MVAVVDSYSNKEERKYIHIVDEGITDNLGIRGLYDRVTLLGGIERLLLQGKIPMLTLFLTNVLSLRPNKTRAF